MPHAASVETKEEASEFRNMLSVIEMPVLEWRQTGAHPRRPACTPYQNLPNLQFSTRWYPSTCGSPPAIR